MTYIEQSQQFIYTFASHEDELSLCRLELRSLFDVDPEFGILKSERAIDPSRSPFIRERIEVLCAGDSLSDIEDHAANIPALQTSFKVLYVKTNDLPEAEKSTYAHQREIERRVGNRIRGRADMHHPDQVFGIVTMGGRWYLGRHVKNRSIWLAHMNKPRNYSMALPARVARAVANIAAPNPEGIKVIDPCCGIGTVLVEALSMGIDISGRELNPQLAVGARENIAFFGLDGEVTYGPISEVTLRYDAAIVDLPYNHVSKITAEEQMSILQHARRIADRVVAISIEPIDEMLTMAGFSIADRGSVKKGSFTRYVMLCV